MIFYGILALVLVLIDQLTKLLTRANIDLGGSVPFIPKFLDFTYYKNTGAAFSILEKHTWLLTVVSAVVVLVVAWLMFRKFFTHWMGMLSATLIVAGGIGNLIDRIAFGYVTDMIRTLFMDFPIFNVADCCITVGVVLLFVYVLFFFDDKKKEAPQDGSDLPADHQ